MVIQVTEMTTAAAVMFQQVVSALGLSLLTSIGRTVEPLRAKLTVLPVESVKDEVDPHPLIELWNFFVFMVEALIAFCTGEF